MQQDNTTREIIHNESPHPFERISNSEGVVDYHICDYLQDIHCPKHMYAHMSCLDCRTVLHSVYQGDYYIQLRDYGYQKSAEKIMTILKYVVLTRNSRTIPPPGQIWTFEYPADTLMKVLGEQIQMLGRIVYGPPPEKFTITGRPIPDQMDLLPKWAGGKWSNVSPYWMTDNPIEIDYAQVELRAYNALARHWTREKWYKRVWRRLRLKITMLPILKHTRYFKTMKYKLVYGG